ncbi:MAG TPA: recombinase family protein, partial [Mycobacteriales bacterium]|nr:recombinase family protein [Mycobacteriales bacterium]
MIAAIYTRISRDDEGRGLGVERQRADCERLVASRGWDLGEVFVENDVSASTASRKPRPEYERMLAEVRAGRYSVVVAYSNSRLTRRPREWMDLIDLANKGAVQIHTVVSGSHDLGTADGRAVALTVAAWDAAEAERTSERLKRQKEDRAARGLPQGGRYRSFGYTRTFEPIPDEAEVVRDIFERRAKGQSATSIAAELAMRGLVTAAGKFWTPSAVSKLISRPGYAGLREYKGNIIGATSYPPLVEESLWRAANGEAARSSPGTNARRWLLSGLAVCGKCGAPMAGTAATNSYRCNSARGGCGNTKIKSAWLEGPVVSVLLARMEAPVTVPSAALEASEPVDFTAIDDRIDEVRQAYSAGHLDLADMTSLLSGLRAQRRAAEQAASRSAPPPVQGPIAGISEWVRADLSRRRSLVGQQVRVISVGPRTGKGPGKFEPERITITWADGSSIKVTARDLKQVPYWNPEAGTWRLPPGVPTAALTHRRSDFL